MNEKKSRRENRIAKIIFLVRRNLDLSRILLKIIDNFSIFSKKTEEYFSSFVKKDLEKKIDFFKISRSKTRFLPVNVHQEIKISMGEKTKNYDLKIKNLHQKKEIEFENIKKGKSQTIEVDKIKDLEPKKYKNTKNQPLEIKIYQKKLPKPQRKFFPKRRFQDMFFLPSGEKKADILKTKKNDFLVEFETENINSEIEFSIPKLEESSKKIAEDFLKNYQSKNFSQKEEQKENIEIKNEEKISILPQQNIENEEKINLLPQQNIENEEKIIALIPEKNLTHQQKNKFKKSKIFRVAKEMTTFAFVFVFVFGIFHLAINAPAFWQILDAKINPEKTIQQEIALENISEKKVNLPLVLPTAGIKRIQQKNFPNLTLAIAPLENRIVIPKIGKNVPVVNISDESLVNENWTQLEKDIQEGLRDGVVHYPGTAGPGEIGNFFITGHSSYYVWDSGKFKDVFARLHDLEVGDDFTVFWDQNVFQYKIKEKKVVSPENTEVLEQPLDKKISTLMTCTPVGTAKNRLILVADQIFPEI